MDLIRLTDLAVSGKHGANEGERDYEQQFLLNIEIEINLGIPGSTDNLADTVDYSRLHGSVTRIVKNTSYNLLERLGSDIMDEIFLDRRVARASVRVAKPGRLKGCTPEVILRRDNPQYSEK